MIDFLPFIQVAPLFVVSMVSPGPCFVLVSRIALSQGRADGVKCGAGISTAETILAAISLWGLGLVLQQMVWLTVVVKIGGGAYLSYLGLQILRATFTVQAPEAGASAESSTLIKTPYRTGVWANLTNPSALAYFSSVFALVITPEMTDATKGVTALLCGSLVFLWFIFVSYVLAVPRLRAAYQKKSSLIDRVMGILLILYGGRLLFSL